MSNSTVKLEGWSELKQAFKELPAKMEKNVIRGALDNAARDIAARAKATTVFQDRTGNLRTSIEAYRPKQRSGLVSSIVRALSPHAHLVEFGWMQKSSSGTRQIPGRPFLVPALEENRADILRLIGVKIKELIAKKLTKLKK